MRIVHTYIFIFLIMTVIDARGQTDRYVVDKVDFSTMGNNEFSPAYYNDGLVFCSDIKNNSVVTTKNSDGSGMINLYYAKRKDSTRWREIRLFSNELTSAANDGPASFIDSNKVVYYSRNYPMERSHRKEHNMGIFSAELIESRWVQTEEFEYNNQNYSLFSPSVSPDGTKLFFASDMPGGFGGMDIYYCHRKDTSWDKPVNLGSIVNTAGNEVFPFYHTSGRLYFSSDSLGGLGGKDIFYTELISGSWIEPTPIEAPINSAFDDFAFIADAEAESGYFSSNRDQSDDIFSFRTNYPEFDNCSPQEANNFCFLFYDEKYSEIDTLPVMYEWHFDNGRMLEGKEVEYCFSNPGWHFVELSILDQLTGDTLVRNERYEFTLTAIEQPYIQAPDTAYVSTRIELDANQTNLPDFSVQEYYWDFGDGTRCTGEEVSHTYTNTGVYNIILGLEGAKNESEYTMKKCVSKQIVIGARANY